MIENLNTNFIGKNIIWTKETVSTNNDAKNSNEKNGTVFITDLQTGGKGRLGRQWVSPPCSGLTMSILLKPEKEILNLQCITLLTGLAVCNAINKLCNIKSLIKWPNDVIIGTKKVCGILTEGAAKDGEIDSVVVGIGVNVTTDNFTVEIKKKATSLLLETGISYNRKDLAKEILIEFEKYYENLLKGNISDIIKEYEKKCVNIGRESVFILNNTVIKGKAIGISKNGELIVNSGDKIVSVSSGEVSAKGIYDE